MELHVAMVFELPDHNYIYYSGANGAARKFAEEMLNSGIVDAIRAENGYNEWLEPVTDEQYNKLK